jgi:hypothetical protein
MGGGGWGGMGGGQRGGGGQGQGSGQGQGGGRGQNSGEGADETAELSQLAIEQTATSAKVTGSSGRVLAVYSNADSSKSSNSSNSSNSGSSSTTSTNSGASSSSGNATSAENRNAPAAAEWQGSQLIAVTQGRRGATTTRTYELSPDGNQLYVTTKIDSPRFQQPVTFRFVYDAANANGGGSE